MVLAGGDDLEENFVLDGSSSESESLSERIESDLDDSVSDRPAEDEHRVDETPCDDEAAVPQAKKQKLNWREAAMNTTGDETSQRSILKASLSAFGKYFPNSDLPFTEECVDKLTFVDCSEFCSQESKTVGDMFMFLKKVTTALDSTTGEKKKLRALVIAGSATRAMYLVKELREMDSKLAPLPLFFHGGGRKKEQARTHETVLASGKTSVAVCLPSRVKSVSDAGLVDFSSLELILFDLKQNEKKLNVLSQKDTLQEVLELVGTHIIRSELPLLKLALI
jgi:hypothetical protein